MRSLIGFLALGTTLLVAAAIAVPAFVRPMVVSAVQAASPFTGEQLDVRADLNALDLLRGVVGRIQVTGRDLERPGMTIATLDVTASEVGIGDHAFASAAGSLDGVTIHLNDGSDLALQSIGVSGPSTDITAVARLDAAQATTFIKHAFDEQGVSVGDIRLAEGGVSFVIFEQRVTVPLQVENGALVVPDLLGNGPLELLAPQDGDPWRLTSMSISAAGMELDATVDGDRLLANG